MKPCILLRSSWQVVNIGDIAHTPGVMALLKKYIPEAEVILWASEDLTEEVAAMEHKRFPGLKIVQGELDQEGRASNKELAEAIEKSSFLLHGSGPSLVAWRDVEAYSKHTGKPYGVFGITYNGKKELVPVLSGARFVYFRDTPSLDKAREAGVDSPVMAFGPDGAFAVDLRDDEKALAFMEENGLEEGKFVCVIGRFRYTPYWKIKNHIPYDEEKHQFNEKHKEKDHADIRKAIVEIVRNTDLKVLICPEDASQMAVGKEMILDKLPEDVLPRVVWREKFWLTDEALSIYVRSAGLFGNEMHSPIMCIGNGIPAIISRFDEQTTKGYMWDDIGLGQWLFHIDSEASTTGLPEAVLEMVQKPEEAKALTLAARERVNQLFVMMTDELRKHVLN